MNSRKSPRKLEDEMEMKGGKYKGKRGYDL
jgi:hypothetical protein